LKPSVSETYSHIDVELFRQDFFFGGATAHDSDFHVGRNGKCFIFFLLREIMAERVSTGGNMQFHYQKGHRPETSKEYKLEIEEAYNKYYDRRRKERKNQIIFWIVVAILILLAFGIWWFSRN
jgi:hypothetical protein